MTGKWVYPKRTDGVFAIRFDGSGESAREIATTLQLVVRHRISPHLAEESELEIGGLTSIKRGQYIIIDENHDVVEVIWDPAYHAKYVEQ